MRQFGHCAYNESVSLVASYKLLVVALPRLQRTLGLFTQHYLSERAVIVEG